MWSASEHPARTLGMKLIVSSRAASSARISVLVRPTSLQRAGRRRALFFSRFVIAAACALWSSTAIGQSSPNTLAVADSASSVGATATIASGLEEGDRFARSGDWASARGVYEDATERSADSVAGWYRLGVARAIGGDASGAAEAFRRVRQLAPELPEIDNIIAAAEERAAYDEEQALDPSAVFADVNARTAARSEALAARLWLHGVRYELVGEPGEAPAADALTASLEGGAVAAAEAASHAAAQNHQDPSHYLVAAQRWLLAGDLERARYFLSLYETFEGDPSVAAPLFEELRAPL